jgi:AraC family transcriptional regulator, ethanolamine operon transcriptional activator
MSETFDHHTFSELSVLQGSLRTLRVNGIATEPGAFRGSISGMHLPDLGVEVVRSGPAVLFGRAEQGRAGYLLLLDGTEGAKLDGCDVDRRDVVCLRPGLPVAASFSVPIAFAFLSAQDGAAAEVLGCPADPGRMPGRPPSLHRAAAAAHRRLVTTIRAAERAARPDQRAAWPLERCRALRASMIEASRELLSGPTPAPGLRGRAVARHRVVRATDEYLCASPMRPIYTGDLCTALGVSASALHEAFQMVFGMSPHRFLKLRRMALVRAALLTRSGPWSSVKAAALSNGFWHLGQFAHDYKAIFGELPSATLARATVP